MQNSVLSTRMTSLYGFQPSPVILRMQTTTLGPNLQVCMGPRPHQLICARITACLAPESLVSIGPSPHLWFLHARQRLQEQNNKSLCVPDNTCGSVHAKQHAYQ